MQPRGKQTITAQQLLGHISLSHGEDACRMLRGAAEQVARGDVAPDAFGTLCAELIRGLCDTYHTMMDDEDDPLRFASVWSFDDAQTYLDRLEKWLAGFCTRLAQEFADFENKQRFGWR